jgi:hypothetical protein
MFIQNRIWIRPLILPVKHTGGRTVGDNAFVFESERNLAEGAMCLQEWRLLKKKMWVCVLTCSTPFSSPLFSHVVRCFTSFPMVAMISYLLVSAEVYSTSLLRRKLFFLFSEFRRVLNVVFFLLGYSPASEFVSTFRNTVRSCLYHLTSEHGMEITIVTEAHCFHKSRMGTALTLSFGTWFQELCLNIELNSTYRRWKSYWTRFREWGSNSNETRLVPFCTKCPWSFSNDSKALPSESRRDQPPTLFIWPRVSLFLTKFKSDLKLIFQDVDDIKNNGTAELSTVPFGHLQCLFCVTPRNV